MSYRQSLCAGSVARAGAILILILSAGLAAASDDTGNFEPAAVVGPILAECRQLIEVKAFADALVKADDALVQSIELHDGAGEAIAQEYRARSLAPLDRQDEAITAWAAAVEAWERVGNGPRMVRARCYQAGLVAISDHEAAMDLLVDAVAVAKQETLQATSAAVNLREAGLRAMKRRQLEAAEYLTRAALEISERTDFDSLESAMCLHNLGAIASYREQVTVAWSYFERALQIKSSRAPDSATLATTLNNMGVILRRRGDMDAARIYFERALAIKETLDPESRSVASTLNNLGIVAFQQRDLAASRLYLERAEAIKAKHMPNSLSYAATLVNLGILALLEKQPDRARDYLEQSLQIKMIYGTGTYDHAVSLINLGGIAEQQGDLDAARSYFAEALEIARDLADETTLMVGSCLTGLGSVALKDADYESARPRLEEARDIQRRYAPHSFALARTLRDLGELEAAQQDLEAANTYYEDAWSIIRDQWRTVVDDETIQNFGEGYIGYANRLVELQLELGRPLAAYDYVEQSRALGLLRLLADRDFVAEAGGEDSWLSLQAAEEAMQAAGEKLSRARSTEDGLSRALDGLEADELSSGDRAALQEQHVTAQKARKECLAEYTASRVAFQVELRNRRRTIPGLDPLAISYNEIACSLPANSLFISYLVGDESTQIFVLSTLGGAQISNYAVATGSEDLAARVTALADAIAAGRDATIAFSHRIAELRAASDALSHLLFPAGLKRELAMADRVVFSPDGPLWQLPFAALVMSETDGLNYLGAQIPISYSPSFTVMAIDRERNRLQVAGGPNLVVGDPLFERRRQAEGDERDPGGDAMSTMDSTPRLRTYLYTGKKPPPRLPGTLVEASKIASLYACEAMHGASATEAAVRDRLESATVVHLATHGYFHPYRAMSSGVLLTPPAAEADYCTQNDGALQAWEFLSGVRTSAELVVLSACETGRGRIVRGEGLVGLTRSLQVAGARSVVATHWQIADEASAELMIRFHELLVKGVAKDEALRLAMAEAIDRGLADPLGDPSHSHPYYWAGFFLTGDPDGVLSFSHAR